MRTLLATALVALAFLVAFPMTEAAGPSALPAHPCAGDVDHLCSQDYYVQGDCMPQCQGHWETRTCVLYVDDGVGTACVPL